ncbi:MAG: NADH-quinone oxidoreductase subunit F [Chloroflexi bacterium]|nr:NADH-quinone oxidoreductase subunit F [Chloroflexota bacterium]
MNRQEFEALQQRAKANLERLENPSKPVVIVSMDSASMMHGSTAVKLALEKEVASRGLDVIIRKTGGIGLTYLEPVVDVVMSGKPRVSYGPIRPEMVPEFVRRVVAGAEVANEWAIGNFSDHPVDGVPSLWSLPFFEYQQRIVLKNAGYVDPDNIEEYIARGGYQAMVKALFELGPVETIEQVKRSGIRGRGGAGFPAGRKWESARAEKRTPKYMICNAHEGEPNVFKDRRILESDPHAVIEGLILGGFGIGTPYGMIYIGAEYPVAVERTLRAIEQAREYGFLGQNILGSGFTFDITPRWGGGAYVCGESSALMYSIEGKRGMPRTKPPRSVEAGLWMLPTSLNNVETLSNMAQIVINGGDWYAAIGTEGSKGTKVFSLAGMTNRVGLIELPMGSTLRRLVVDAGGGVREGRQLKGVATGGPSGGIVPTQFLDMPVDIESLDKIGGTLGSGGFIVLDDTVCMVDLSRYFMHFNRIQSCGKCVPCRIGTRAMLDILDRIATGEGREGDVELLEDTGHKVIDTALCGLGQTAPLPTLSTIRYFRNEYDAHIREKHCLTGRCEIRADAPVLAEA